jgi:hypothetical protein
MIHLFRLISEKFAKGGDVVGEELMGGQPNKSQKSGYKLLSVKHGDKLIVVTDNDGETKEHWVKNNNYSGYTLHYNGNQYEFANSFKYAKGGSVDSVKISSIKKGDTVSPLVSESKLDAPFEVTKIIKNEDGTIGLVGKDSNGERFLKLKADSVLKKYAKIGEGDGEWRKGTTIKFRTKKEAKDRLDLHKNHPEEYRNLSIEKVNYGDKLNDGYVVKFEYLKKEEYANGGSVASGEWVVYNATTDAIIEVKRSHRAALIMQNRLFSTGNYEAIGIMAKSEWDADKGKSFQPSEVLKTKKEKGFKGEEIIITLEKKKGDSVEFYYPVFISGFGKKTAVAQGWTLEEGEKLFNEEVEKYDLQFAKGGAVGEMTTFYVYYTNNRQQEIRQEVKHFSAILAENEFRNANHDIISSFHGIQLS